jgi:hypothetical protein
MTGVAEASTIPPLRRLLVDADHVDVKTAETDSTLREFLTAMLNWQPAWISALFRLRPLLARALRLDEPDAPRGQPLVAAELELMPGGKIAFFTVTAAEDDRYAVLEAADNHLAAYLGVVVEQTVAGPQPLPRAHDRPLPAVDGAGLFQRHPPVPPPGRRQHGEGRSVVRGARHRRVNRPDDRRTGMRATTAAAAALNLWAARLLIAISCLHLALFTVLSSLSGHLPGWLTGDLIGAVGGATDPMRETEAEFWRHLGSFALPLIVVGLLIATLARAGLSVPRYVGYGVGAWVVACSLMFEPSGFPTLLVPVALLIRAHRLDGREPLDLRERPALMSKHAGAP